MRLFSSFSAASLLALSMSAPALAQGKAATFTANVVDACGIIETYKDVDHCFAVLNEQARDLDVQYEAILAVHPYPDALKDAVLDAVRRSDVSVECQNTSPGYSSITGPADDIISPDKLAMLISYFNTQSACADNFAKELRAIGDAALIPSIETLEATNLGARMAAEKLGL